MSIRVSGGVYLVPTSGLQESNDNSDTNNQQQQPLQQPQQSQQQQQLHAQLQAQLQQRERQHHHNHSGKTVTIVAGPQRSNSLDYLNFEEKRQLIASSLSLSDFLAHGPAAAAAAAAKEVAANTVVIGEKLRILMSGCILVLFIFLFFFLSGNGISETPLCVKSTQREAWRARPKGRKRGENSLIRQAWSQRTRLDGCKQNYPQAFGVFEH